MFALLDDEGTMDAGELAAKIPVAQKEVVKSDGAWDECGYVGWGKTTWRWRPSRACMTHWVGFWVG